MSTSEEKKKKDAEWRKSATTQFAMRFSNSTGIPDAIRAAAKKTHETTAEYTKRAILQRLERDGFLREKDIVLNMNKERHKEAIRRLKKYVAEEEAKMK